jgi:hypothetical protein
MKYGRAVRNIFYLRAFAGMNNKKSSMEHITNSLKFDKMRAVAQWLRHYATSQKFEGLSSDEVIAFYQFT